MDFLDPKKQRFHTIRLSIIYVVTAIAVLIVTAILLRIAHGAGLNKNGEVVQNGFVFVSSQPGGSRVYLDNKLTSNTTSTRLQLPAGPYTLDIQRTGYRRWHQAITVHGDSVIRYDYPLLVPTDLIANPVKIYSTVPPLTLQSPDRHWMLVQQPGSLVGFDMIDISNPKSVTSSITTLTMPESVLTAASGEQAWHLVEWSNDNRHVLLSHTSNSGSEFVLLDRSDPTKTVNLTKTLHLSAGQTLALRDKKYDQYYVFDSAAKTVSSLNLSDPATLTPVLTGVLAFKSYGSDMLLYATDTSAAPGHILTMLREGDNTYKIADHVAGSPYLLDLAQYSGDWYIAVGTGADNKVAIYKNPQSVRRAGKVTNLKPVYVLKVASPNHLEFSSNTRFIMAENGTNFAVYDAEYLKGYTYAASQPLDAPQQHAVWMDGDRISYVSGGKQVFFDFDNTNPQIMSASAPSLLPFFDRDYKYVYNFAPASAATGQSILTQTSLLIPQEQ